MVLPNIKEQRKRLAKASLKIHALTLYHRLRKESIIGSFL